MLGVLQLPVRSATLSDQIIILGALGLQAESRPRQETHNCIVHLALRADLPDLASSQNPVPPPSWAGVCNVRQHRHLHEPSCGAKQLAGAPSATVHGHPSISPGSIEPCLLSCVCMTVHGRTC